MKRAALFILSLGVAMQSFGADRLIVPNVPDVTLTITESWSNNTEFSQSRVFSFKGAWQRTELIVTGHPLEVIRIDRCDERATILLNGERQLYRRQPLAEMATRLVVSSRPLSRDPLPQGPMPAPTVQTTMTEDTRDTGERRQIGPFSARHVITASATRSIVRGQEHVSTEERDGWYVDLPLGCFDPIVRNSRAADIAGVRMVRTGSGRRGLAVEEVWRRSFAANSGAPSVQTTTYSVVADRKLDTALFEVPAGYGPALPIPGYGHDMRRPDTWLNRLSAYWESTTLWVSELIRSF